MGESFQLDHERLGRDPRFAAIVRELGAQPKIDSPETFNSYCRKACQFWSETQTAKARWEFDKLNARVEEGGEGVIQTGWGGVVITIYEHPRVEKFLVVGKGGYLALEKHAEKDEWLEVQEGAGLVLWRQSPNEPLTVEVLEQGVQFHFSPGMEHCLIGTDDLLVFERSIDPKGMDQD